MLRQTELTELEKGMLAAARQQLCASTCSIPRSTYDWKTSVNAGPPITRSTARKYRDMLVALVGG